MMKNKKLQIILIALTFFSLIALLAIQVSWIYKAANIQEKQFSHSANAALKQVVDQMAKDTIICNEVVSCIGKDNTRSCYQAMSNNNEWKKVNSIIKEALKTYQININYEFDIVDTRKDADFNVCKKSYFSNNLEKTLLKNGIELKIKFPKKSEFIIAQIGSIFISSIVLIILISISFYLILKYYRREKALYLGTRDFINNITHEFKTPLTNIALANSMISKNENVSGDEKLHQYSEIIRTEHKKLTNRVEALLDIARIENGKTGFCESIDICNIIKCTADSYQVQVQQLNGKITLEKLAERCSVHADKEQFQIVISNLIDNAIKYCNKEPEIIIRTSNKGNYVIIDIEDNGIGIKPEHQKQIFEKYYRVPTGDMHNVKGFGIGLSTVKSIIESMNGEIDLHSKPGKGTKFSIKLAFCE
jgi:two-component system, OmpR family, phosphate regulon sensor histidine kinase PhoR